MGTSGDRDRDLIARRRLSGQLLRESALTDAGDVVAHLTAMQAQEHGHARWSIGQRMSASPTAAAVDAAFDEGRFLRTHVLRPTWHYVAARDLRWLIGLSGPRVDAANSRRHQELGLDVATLARSSDVIAEAVAGEPRTRRELAAVIEERGMSSEGQRLPYMLMHAELTATICSGPMRGRQHTYAAFDQRVPDEPGPDGDEALAELARRYFSTRGPATLKDFSWWSGLGASQARQAVRMAQATLVSRDIGGRTYWFTDESAPRSRRPRMDLIQCYDELIISYTESRDALQTTDVTFPVPRDLEGFRHVVVVDGRLLGHWRSGPGDSGAIETRVGRPLSGAEKSALTRAVEARQRFTDPTRR